MEFVQFDEIKEKKRNPYATITFFMTEIMTLVTESSWLCIKV